MPEKPSYEELAHRIRGLEQKVAKFKQIEEDFKESQVELDALFNKAPLIMFVVDHDRRVCKLNEAAVVMTRRLEKESIGLLGGEALCCVNSFDVPRGCGFSPTCKSCVIRNTVLDTFRTGQGQRSVEAPIPYGAENGTVVLQVLVSTTFLNLPQGERVLVCIEDITERKQAEKELQASEKRYRQLVENIAEQVWEVDTNGVYTYISPRTIDVYGLKPEKVIGKTLFDLMPAKEAKRVAHIFNKKKMPGNPSGNLKILSNMLTAGSFLWKRQDSHFLIIKGTCWVTVVRP